MRGRVCACMRVRVRFNYCKRYIKQKHHKKHFCTTTTKKRGKKAPLKIHYLKKTLKNSLFTRVEKKIIFLHIFVVIVKKVYFYSVNN